MKNCQNDVFLKTLPYKKSNKRHLFRKHNTTAILSLSKIINFSNLQTKQSNRKRVLTTKLQNCFHSNLVNPSSSGTEGACVFFKLLVCSFGGALSWTGTAIGSMLSVTFSSGGGDGGGGWPAMEIDIL